MLRYLPVLVILSSCAHPPAPAADPAPDCRALVAAAPAAWPAAWDRAHAHGPRAGAALITALRAQPDGAGAQAAIHLLGDLRVEAARAFLEETLTVGTSLAPEAGLALGRLPGDASRALLLRVVASQVHKTEARAAAAAALIRHGHGAEVAPFLEAVFLAATPYVGSTTRKFGFPRTKIRWALERYMLIEALRATYPDHTWRLDEDAAWPALRDGAAGLRAFFRSGR